MEILLEGLLSERSHSSMSVTFERDSGRRVIASQDIYRGEYVTEFAYYRIYPKYIAFGKCYDLSGVYYLQGRYGKTGKGV